MVPRGHEDIHIFGRSGALRPTHQGVGAHEHKARTGGVEYRDHFQGWDGVFHHEPRNGCGFRQTADVSVLQLHGGLLVSVKAPPGKYTLPAPTRKSATAAAIPPTRSSRSARPAPRPSAYELSARPPSTARTATPRGPYPP